MIKLNGSFGSRILEITSGRVKIDDEKDVINMIREINDAHGVTSQIFDAKRIAGREHLIHASRLALIAMKSGDNFADDLSIELTCWAASTRQIDQALKLVGIHKKTKAIALIVIGSNQGIVKQVTEEISEKLQIEQDGSVLDITPEKAKLLKEVFSISDAQLAVAGLKDLILEGIALLSLEK